MAPAGTGSRLAAPAAAATLLAAATAGCAGWAEPLETEPAVPAAPTRVADDLAELPPPDERVVAAVYRFRDQTGQYKVLEQGVSWSTAVTQGATSILVRALAESGWFVVIEREGLSNLLNERQIIQSIRAQYEGPEGEGLGQLPPLLYAGVLLEGGIIGYDTNLLTSGVGARYFGAGGSAQAREDQVTVYLRAVSTQSGRVLKTVTTTKTIASQRVDAGIFRFVDIDRLLEAEVGYAFNEPPVVAVTEAIQEAVRNLVVEGVRDGLWALADPADLDHPAFSEHAAATDRAARLGPFGQASVEDRDGLALSVGVGARRYQGNYRDPLTRPVGDVALRWMFGGRWGLGLSAAVGQIGAEDAFRTTAGSVALETVYNLLPGADTTPFARLGVGLLRPDLEAGGSEIGESLFPFVAVGAGIERRLAHGTGLTLSLSNHWPLMDGLDGVTDGSGHDSVWNAAVGVTVYR